MLSAPKHPSTKVKAEEDEVEEEEAKGLRLQSIKLAIVMNTQNIHNTLTTLKVKGEEERDGPISQTFNVTTARSMAIMNEIAERSKHTKTMADPMSLKNKKARHRLCSSPTKKLKNIAANI